MAGVYRPRHPERTVLYRVLFHHFERFLTEYEGRFEREYGYFRPVVKEVVERYLDCGNPRCGFARIRCPDCAEERLVMFSCRSRGFCPSCHAKRINFHPHLHFLVTEGGVDRAGVFHLVPRIDDSRLEEIFAREVLEFLGRKELLSPEWAERLLSWRHTGFSVHSLVRATTKTEAERVGKYMIRPLLALERLSFLEQEGKVAYRYGQAVRETETMDYLEFIARVTSHIPDKGQVTVRYYGLYSNAHRGKVRKARLAAAPLRIVEEELRRVPSKGWAAMIRKVYEVDPMTCPRCGGAMRVVAFLTEHAVVDRIIEHLKLTFVAAKPPPSQVAFQELLTAADRPADYFA